jgi:ankyrin repeat protein
MLVIAAEGASLRLGAELLEELVAVCDPSLTDDMGRDALMAAAASASASGRSARILAEICDSNAKDHSGRTALAIAIEKRNEEYANALIGRSGMDFVSPEGATPLMLAAGFSAKSKRKAQPGLVRALLPHSDLAAKDHKGLTAFAWALKAGCAESMEMLAEGASLALARKAVERHGEKIPCVRAWLDAREIQEALRAGGGAGSGGKLEKPAKRAKARVEAGATAAGADVSEAMAAGMGAGAGTAGVAEAQRPRRKPRAL